MEKYKIEIKKSAYKELSGLPSAALKKILRLIGALADEPRPHASVKLSAQEKYRIRSGNYRVLYSIDDDVLVIYVVKVGHRREVYRRK